MTQRPIYLSLFWIVPILVLTFQVHGNTTEKKLRGLFTGYTRENLECVEPGTNFEW